MSAVAYQRNVHLLATRHQLEQDRQLHHRVMETEKGMAWTNMRPMIIGRIVVVVVVIRDPVGVDMEGAHEDTLRSGDSKTVSLKAHLVDCLSNETVTSKYLTEKKY